MFPTHDMNPIAIDQMRREREAADMERARRSAGLSLPAGGTIVLILVVFAFLI